MLCNMFHLIVHIMFVLCSPALFKFKSTENSLLGNVTRNFNFSENIHKTVTAAHQLE